MLSVKQWKTSAIGRLAGSLFVSGYSGTLVLAVFQHAVLSGKQKLRVYGLAAAALMCFGISLVLLWKRWRLETAIGRMVGLLLCLYTGIFVGAWALKSTPPVGPSAVQMIVAALSFQGAALIFIDCFLSEHDTNWKDAFGFCHHWPQAIMFGVILAGVFLPLGLGLQWLSAKIIVHLPRLHIKPEEQQAVQTLQLASAWVTRVALGAVTILLAPVAEEILFRGILYSWIKQTGYPRLALWGNALLFAAVHENLMTFLPLAVLALALTFLYEKTNNLLAPITAHAVFNGMNFVALYYVLPN